MKCLWKTCEKVAVKKFCSKNCRLKWYVDRRRKDLKKLAVAYLGGQCTRCGYKKCLRALHFHHKEKNKAFGVSNNGITRAWEKVRTELDKCEILCANCHAEHHATPL